MKHSKRLPGLSGAKCRRGLVYIGCASLLLTIVIIVIWPRPVRYELNTAAGDVDFTAPELTVHTAEDGVAVVRPQPREAIPEASSPTAGEPTPLPEVWAEDTTAIHGGFSLPVSMDEADSIGVLTIPDLGLSVCVYESEDEMEAMSMGVAHFKHTSAWEGNVGLSAHNINFDGSAGYFRDLHLLSEGAVIQYETAHGTRAYTVTAITEIAETDWSGLTRTEDNRLTLITCISGKPEKRLCVQAVQSQG